MRIVFEGTQQEFIKFCMNQLNIQEIAETHLNNTHIIYNNKIFVEEKDG